MNVKDTNLLLGVASAVLLMPCYNMPSALADMPPVVVDTMPTYAKVDLTCVADGGCAGSINFGTNYTLHSITCLAAAAEFFYGYADISMGSLQTRKYISPNHVSPRYYWLNPWRYMTINQDIEQPATQASFQINIGNGWNLGGGGWVQCYTTGTSSYELVGTF